MREENTRGAESPRRRKNSPNRSSRRRPETRRARASSDFIKKYASYGSRPHVPEFDERQRSPTLPCKVVWRIFTVAARFDYRVFFILHPDSACVETCLPPAAKNRNALSNTTDMYFDCESRSIDQLREYSQRDGIVMFTPCSLQSHDLRVVDGVKTFMSKECPGQRSKTGCKNRIVKSNNAAVLDLAITTKRSCWYYPCYMEDALHSLSRHSTLNLVQGSPCILT